MNDLVKRVEDFAKPFCEKYTEDPKLWDNHIRLVRIYARKLAEIEKADTLVCEIAAILHDIGKCKGRKGHNELSRELAEPFVRRLAISEKQKELILKCVLKHSNKYFDEDDEIEVKVLQSADALGTFFDEDWQEYSRSIYTKQELLGLYEKTFSKINLDSVKDIGKQRVDRLKKLIDSE